MKYDDALKEVKATKPKENFLLVRLNYDTQLLLPHADGLQLVASLARAEKLIDRYSESKRIVELDKEAITVTPFSHKEYERYKIAALLNCSPEDVKQYAEAGLPIPEPAPQT